MKIKLNQEEQRVVSLIMANADQQVLQLFAGWHGPKRRRMARKLFALALEMQTDAFIQSHPLHRYAKQ